MVSAGQLVCRVRKYSDSLLMLLLKGKCPDTFRERFEHTGKNGRSLGLPDDIRRESDEELKARALEFEQDDGPR